MNFEIVTTSLFQKQAKRSSKKFPSLKKDLQHLEQTLLRNPKTGIDLGNGFYKIRLAIAIKGKGISGGARIITYLLLNRHPGQIYLCALYDKSEIASISDQTLSKILK